MKLISACISAIILSAVAFSLSVTVVGRKQVYQRQKPIGSFKRTFTIRRPAVKVPSLSISRAMSAAVDPERVLEINLEA